MNAIISFIFVGNNKGYLCYPRLREMYKLQGLSLHFHKPVIG